MDINAKYGDTKVVEAVEFPDFNAEDITLVCQGFPVTVMVKNQHDARKIKAEFRGRGYQAEYGNPVWLTEADDEACKVLLAEAHAAREAQAAEAAKVVAEAEQVVAD